MGKRALMVAFHFPPLQGSSGIQRTLSFVRYLPEAGWEPIVLTAHPRAYARVSDDQRKDVPAGTVVKRAFALDTAKHLAIGSHYPRFLALPDRWVSWWFGGVISGLHLIRKYKPAVLFSTYPVATAHLIGLTLSKLTGLPWVADFRDPMTDEDYPPDPRLRKVHDWLESSVLKRCERAVVTTPGTYRMYAEKFPDLPRGRLCEIQNGYDEENFATAERRAAQGTARPAAAPVTLVHSGILYPSERDPRAFFSALSALKEAGRVSADRVRVFLRATGHDGYLNELIRKAGVGDLVELAPPIAYEEALAEMLRADGLLLFQAANCNLQIPAKLYEYLRARRPILAITDPAGDTARTLREAGIDTIVRIDSKDDITGGFMKFVESVQRGTAPTATPESVRASSRRARVSELARVFDQVCESGDALRCRPV
jgi:glycosyltransferase involved in cell wall biosynthesis